MTREEIAAHLWERPELVDTVGGINTAIKKIRAVLNDEVGQPRYIETVVGRGYRFIGQVDAVETERPAPPAPITLVTGLEKPIEKSAPAVTSARPRVAWKRWAAAIAPDGNLLAYADSDGVWLRELKTGATHQLKTPEQLEASRIAWFPDGLRVLLSGADKATGQAQIWIASVLGAAPILIREGARNGAPSPDGEQIASIDKEGAEIWVTNSDGSNSRRLLSAQRESSFLFVFWLPDSKALGYQKRSFEPHGVAPRDLSLESNYDWRYEVADAESGKVVSSTDGVHFNSAACTRDGLMWFVRSLLTRDVADLGIWEAQIDARNGRFLAAPKRRIGLNDQLTFDLSVSNDGREVATLVQAVTCANPGRRWKISGGSR